ncbi:MAG TPA: hypothetical protein P5527_09460 [Kiritimatiellia bacterium]|nr:hypothetical protein [Kiritimatiellia bacterium]
MKTQTPFNEIAAIDRELLELAPRIRQGFERLGGPSARVEQTIREEARRVTAGLSRARLTWPLRRILAAAASLALLLGGTALWFASQRAGQETQGLAQQPAAAHIDETTASFASLLMEIQGLNEDGFFRTEEAESLWL